MGKGKKTETKVIEKTDQHSWIMDIPGMQEAGRAAVAENGQIPDITYIPFNQQQLDALNRMQAGQDQSQFQEGAQNYVNYAQQAMNQGSNMMSLGQGYSSQGMNTLQRLANMGADDYNTLISSYINSDLVKKQEAQSTKDLTEQYNSQVQDLNHSAISQGAMGSSRAGVMQGVAFGKTQDAIARANLGIEQTAYQNALGMAQFQVGQQSTYANQMLSYGQGQQQLGLQTQAQGMSAYNTGLNWYQQIRQNNIADINNQWTAGSLLQQQNQQQAEVARQNQYQHNNQALLHWQSLVGAYAPAASWSTSGTTNTNTTTKSSGGGGMMGGIMGAVGAGVGGFFGGPLGAQVGAGLGSSIGNSMG